MPASELQTKDEQPLLVLPRAGADKLVMLRAGLAMTRLDDEVWSDRWLRVRTDTGDGKYEGYVEASRTTWAPPPHAAADLPGDETETAVKRIDLEKFFTEVKTKVGARAGGQMQQEGFRTIIETWEEHYPTAPTRWLAYVLATAWHETAFSMQPVREGSVGGRQITEADSVRHVTSLFDKGKIKVNYALPHTNNKRYYGRGFCQLTWWDKYKKLDDRLGLGGALYNDPDEALNKETAAKIICVGMVEGLFAVYPRKGGARCTLERFLPAQNPDWLAARRIINGVDCAEALSTLGQKFYEALMPAVVTTYPAAAAAPAGSASFPETGATDRDEDQADAKSAAAPSARTQPQKPLAKSRTIWASVMAGFAAVGAVLQDAWSNVNNAWLKLTQPIGVAIDLKWVVLVLILALLGFIIYARIDDRRHKGR